MDASESSDALPGSTKVALLVVMGLPGSGKTSLCLSLPHFLDNSYHVIHICYDQVIPFNEVESLGENHGSWKSTRAKVLQATETLIKTLLSSNSPENEVNVSEEDPFPIKHVCVANINGRSMNDTQWFNNANEETRCDSYNIDSRFNLEHSVISNHGHYTMLDSFNDVVSIQDQFSGCDLQNELFVVCVDDNCYYRSMRKEWWNLAAKYELPFSIVALKCEVEVCVRRVKERCNGGTFFGPNVPGVVISRMDKCLEYPDGCLIPWEKNSIVIDSNFPNALEGTLSNSPLLFDGKLKLDAYSLELLNKIRKVVSSSLLEPAKCLNKEKNVCNSSVTTSIVHEADLALRKIVNESDPKIRLQINGKRKKILEDLKSKKLVIPIEVIGEQVESFGNKLDEYMASLVNLHY